MELRLHDTEVGSSTTASRLCKFGIILPGMGLPATPKSPKSRQDLGKFGMELRIGTPPTSDLAEFQALAKSLGL